MSQSIPNPISRDEALAAAWGMTCDGGDCDRRAVSLAFDERIGGLIPVCRRHITAYRIGKGHTGPWQAEDEFAGLRFCRRSRWKWLAQWRILMDQRAAAHGRTSGAQRRKARQADARTEETR